LPRGRVALIPTCRRNIYSTLQKLPHTQLSNSHTLHKHSLKLVQRN
jgi:hypothetical protein